MKIWATGCSWTSGVGLEFPSAETYDSCIINHIGNRQTRWEYNYSEAGHCNHYIFRSAIEISEKMNKDEDVLLVQWTSPFRQELITNDGCAFYAPYDFACLKFLYGNRHELYSTIGPKDIHIDDFRKIQNKKYLDVVKQYSKTFMNETYMELVSYNMQISLHHLLKSIGVKSLQFYAWNDCKIKSKNIWNIIPEDGTFLKETFESVLNDNQIYLTGPEHPNKNGHNIFSKFLVKKLEKLNYIKQHKII